MRYPSYSTFMGAQIYKKVSLMLPRHFFSIILCGRYFDEKKKNTQINKERNERWNEGKKSWVSQILNKYVGITEISLKRKIQLQMPSYLVFITSVMGRSFPKIVFWNVKLCWLSVCVVKNWTKFLQQKNKDSKWFRIKLFKEISQLNCTNNKGKRI